jgi:hypothetical protein
MFTVMTNFRVEKGYSKEYALIEGKGEING